MNTKLYCIIRVAKNPDEVVVEDVAYTKEAALSILKWFEKEIPGYAYFIVEGPDPLIN